MPIDADALQRLLCERLCEDVQLTERPDGALMLRTRFEFPDGDRFPDACLGSRDRRYSPVG